MDAVGIEPTSGHLQGVLAIPWYMRAQTQKAPELGERRGELLEGFIIRYEAHTSALTAALAAA